MSVELQITQYAFCQIIQSISHIFTVNTQIATFQQVVYSSSTLFANTNRYITDTYKTNNSIKHIWQVAREALVLLQLATYS